MRMEKCRRPAVQNVVISLSPHPPIHTLIHSIGRNMTGSSVQSFHSAFDIFPAITLLVIKRNLRHGQVFFLPYQNVYDICWFSLNCSNFLNPFLMNVWSQFHQILQRQSLFSFIFVK